MKYFRDIVTNIRASVNIKLSGVGISGRCIITHNINQWTNATILADRFGGMAGDHHAFPRSKNLLPRAYSVNTYLPGYNYTVLLYLLIIFCRDGLESKVVVTSS